MALLVGSYERKVGHPRTGIARYSGSSSFRTRVSASIWTKLFLRGELQMVTDDRGRPRLGWFSKAEDSDLP